MQTATTDHCHAGLHDVACDVCTVRKRKARKSCLQCLASYCENHLQSHFEAPPLKKHKLVEPSKKLQENVCSRHDEVMKMFCRTDQQSICYLCSLDQHKGHDIVSAAAERSEKQRELEVSRQNIQQRIQDTEKDVKLLQQEVEAINGSADKTVGNSEKMFTELIRLMKKRRSDVKQQVRSHQQTEVSRVRERQKKLEQEITELKRKDAELEKLLNAEDHIWFLNDYPSLSALSESTHSSSIKIRPLRYFEDVTAAVSEVRDKLQDVLTDKWTSISQTVTEVDVLPSEPEPEPKTRAEFLEYSCDITLDPKITQVMTEVDVLRSEPEPKTKAEVLEYSCDITLDPKISRTVAEVDVLPSEPEPMTKAEFLEYPCDISLYPKITQVMTEADVLLSEPEPEPKTKAEVLEYSCDITLDPKISQTVAEVDVLPSEPEPMTKAEVLEYSCDITLDPKISQTVAEVDFLPSEPEPMTKAEVLEYSCDITLDPKISQTVAEVDVLLPEPEPEPTTRDEFLKYSCDITLDSKTEHVYLLSVGNRKVTFMSKHQSYSSHPDRFTYYRQVLSKESLTGRCYWEVERTGRGVCVAVTYKNIRRAGSSDECVFGRNDKSWALDCYNNRYTFWSKKVHTPVSGPQSSRVGVYLDHTAGILSFYSISETMTLLHRVQTTFTQPLHAGLRFGYWCPGDSAELCKLK